MAVYINIAYMTFDPTQLFVFFFLGAVVSYMVGCLGASSSVLYIPILFIALPIVYPTQPELLMPMVIATATASTIFSGVSSTSISFFAREVDTFTIAKQWPWLALGGVLGAAATYALQNYVSVFKGLFAIMLLANAWVVWRHFEPADDTVPIPANAFGGHWYTALAFIASGFGAGAQAYILFLMKKRAQTGRTAIGTARSMNLISNGAAVIPYIYWSYSLPHVNAVAEGYFYLPAMAMFIITTLPFIYLGTVSSRHLPIRTIKKLYAVFMAMAGVWALVYAFVIA